MGIVPNLSCGEWYFLNDILTSLENHICSGADLTLEQQCRHNNLSEYFDTIVDKLGCNSAVTHKIVTNSAPIT